MDGFGNFNFGDMGLDVQMKKSVEEIVVEDVTVINGGKNSNVPAPEGYTRIDVDLNKGTRGDHIYLYVKKGTDKANAINGLEVVSGLTKNVSAPGGYEKIPVDLNAHAGGKYIYLCKRRGGTGVIHDIDVITSKKKVSSAPSGWNMIDKDLNAGAGGEYIYICHK